MTFEEFDKFFDTFIDECRSMRDTKGKEYASSLDRFDNFNRLAKTLDLDRLKIAQVYVQKHLDSVNTYLKTGQVSSNERIRGRFIDIVTYMILMAGMAEEFEILKAQDKVYAYSNCISEVNQKDKFISAEATGNYDTSIGNGCDECGNTHGDTHSNTCSHRFDAKHCLHIGVFRGNVCLQCNTYIT